MCMSFIQTNNNFTLGIPINNNNVPVLCPFYPYQCIYQMTFLSSPPLSGSLLAAIQQQLWGPSLHTTSSLL